MRSRPRGPAAVYATLTILLVVLLATLALTSRQPPPPTIAEFAPQAVQQITESPNDAAARGDSSGTCAGSPCPGGGADPSPTPSGAGAIEVPRVRRCVGDPPRQTEEPQSPPCVPYWSGDNGGATYKGVTRDTIRVAFPDNEPRAAAILENHFNSRYELYGRRLQLVIGGGGNDCVERRAAAVTMDEAEHVFAASDASFGVGGPCFQAEMARRKLISVVDYPTFAESDLAALRPYLWEYAMSLDKMFTSIGEMICARLNSGNASTSPDPTLRGTRRKYGLVLQNVERDIAIDTTPIDRAMSRCGEKIAAKEHLSTYDGSDSGGQQAVQAAILRLKTQGVTTVIMLGIAFAAQYIAVAADSQAYFPEWVFSTYIGMDWNLSIQTSWPLSSQRRSIIGVNIWPPMRAWSMDPAWWAALQADPTLDPARDYLVMNAVVHHYQSMLLLTSGIQLAGPRLTPMTFESGLQRVAFPNPADDPTRSGRVGFARDHSMTDDASEYWWSESAIAPPGNQSPSGGQTGAVCYVDHGARRQTGNWPQGAGSFFQPPCDTGPN